MKEDNIKTMMEVLREQARGGIVQEVIPILLEEMFHGTTLSVMGRILSFTVTTLGGIMFAYQQRKAADNMMKFMQEVAILQDELNQRLDAIEDQEKKQKMIKDYFELVTDYALKATQEEKIKYIVNGYKNLSEQGDFKEDFVLLYYDVLDGLNMLDLRVLNLCVSGGVTGDSIQNVLKEYNINYDQVNYIVDKLRRSGLVEDKRERNIMTNFERLKECIKEGKTDIEFINIKDPDLHERTEFGDNFIKFFEISKIDS